MEINLAEANIVILAQNHNPTIATRDWLLAKEIISEELETFTHLPVLAHYEYKNFTLTIDQNRLQVRAKILNQNVIQKLPQITIKYVEALPETSYRALGFNFDWIIKQKAGDMLAFSRKIFVNPNGVLKDFLDGKEYLIGGLIQFKSDDSFRTQVTVMPEDSETLKITINYHKNIMLTDGKGRLDMLTQAIGKFYEMQKYSEKITTQIIGEKQNV